tara:strand:+ start:257264 stop:257707 length:444 start_codon:yes stop_codon:yes gene_type:complete
MSVRQVLYTSQAVNFTSAEECKDILHTSHTNNPRNDITGFLLALDNGTFLQILEGPHDAVAHSLQRISSDPRHSGLTIIYDEEADERAFAEWSMGFSAITLAEYSQMPAFRNLTTDADFETLFQDGPIVLSVMRTICNANRSPYGTR